MKREYDDGLNTAATMQTDTEMVCMCSKCTSGHAVLWFVVPPPECPYCNAPVLSKSVPCEAPPFDALYN
jgi:hypothetical protein